MRPENLKSPFSWEERRVIIQDRVWFVPDYFDRYEEFTFPGWTHPDLFGNDNPICVEYCSGNGAWIAGKALANPNINWVAIEKKFVRARKIWSKAKNLKLQNLFVICAEGYNVTSRYFPPGTISDIYINFPDPWPKNKHAKHRIIQPIFVEELSRILKKDCCMTFVTDDPPYSQWTIDTLLSSPNFRSVYPAPYFITDEQCYGTSYFDQLWREKGRTIHYHKFCKKLPS